MEFEQVEFEQRELEQEGVELWDSEQGVFGFVVPE